MSMHRPRIQKTGLLALLALIALAACSGYPRSALPADREGTLGQDVPGPLIQQTTLAADRTQAQDTRVAQSQPSLEQDAPTTPSFDLLTVELDTAPSLVFERREMAKCPALDRTLQQIILADNPLELAEALQITTKEDKIQVLLILDETDTGFLADFGAEVGTQSGVHVQAFVPISTLCDVASTRPVIAIHLPAQAVTQ